MKNRILGLSLLFFGLGASLGAPLVAQATPQFGHTIHVQSSDTTGAYSPWIHWGNESERLNSIENLYRGNAIDSKQIADIRRMRQELENSGDNSSERKQHIEELRKLEQRMIRYNDELASTPRLRPLPSGFGPEERDGALEGLKSALVRGNPLQAASATAALNRKLNAYTELAARTGKSRYAEFASVIREDARRMTLDRQGLLRGLPYFESPGLDLHMDDSTESGQKIRFGINQSLAAGSAIAYACAANPEVCSRADRDNIIRGVDELTHAWLAFDHLSHLHSISGAEGMNGETLEAALANLEKASGMLAAFAQGVLEGSMNLVTSTVEGVVTLVTDLPQVVTGLVQAFMHLDATVNIIRDALQSRWNGLIQEQDPARQAHLVGELVPQLASFFFGGAGAIGKIRGLQWSNGALKEFLSRSLSTAAAVSRFGNPSGITNFLGIIGNEIGSIGSDLSLAIKKIKEPSIWTEGKFRDSVKNAFDHWKRHKSEFPHLNNAIEYVEEARAFVKNPPSGTLTKLRPEGDMLLYQPETNVFAVMDSNGIPKTMFKPLQGLQYFERQ